MESTFPVAHNEKLALQAQWAHARMADNPNWKLGMPAPRNHMVHEGKSFVVWRAGTDGKPQIVDLLRVAGISASFTRGLELELSSSFYDKPLKVAAYPREVLSGVFLWLPSFMETRFTPMDFHSSDSVWRLTLMMFARTAGGETPKPGEVAITSRREFRIQWPDLNL